MRSGNSPILLYPLMFPTVGVGEDLGEIVLQAINRQNLKIKNRDLLAVASKVVSICEGRTASLHEVRVSGAARRLAGRWNLNQSLAQLVMDEADAILGGVNGFVLTIRNGFLTANAGVDLKNSPQGTATLWPKNPDESATKLGRFLHRKFRARLGVVIVDSRVTPLRLGTIGLAVGVGGFEPVRDERQKRDIYGRKVRATQINVSDDVASAAHMLMGERDERIGAVLVRNARIRLDGSVHYSDAKLKVDRCLIMNSLKGPMPTTNYS